MKVIKLNFEVFVIFCAFLETKAQTSIQGCVCVPLNTCYQNLSPAAVNGEIDVRIVNGGRTVTIPPATNAPPATLNCATNEEVCCTPSYGCGVRYNIPITPSTTPGFDQGRYGSQPWQAVILGSDNTYVAGGVLLDSLHVLTAAHKIINRAESSIRVRMGEWNANQAVEPYPVQEVGVSRITRHPNFSVNNLYNDLAMLRLASPITIGPNPAINTACRPSATQNFEGLKCLVSGWGKDAFTGSMQSIVKEVDVPIVNSATCQNQLRTTKLGSTFTLNTASFMCAGGETNRDACVGDGGSPLMCNIGGKYQLAGLVAWGIGCGSTSVPGVYVRVQSFLPWIEANLN